MPLFPIFGKRKQWWPLLYAHKMKHQNTDLFCDPHIVKLLSVCELLMIWNRTDKGAESFPLLSISNKLPWQDKWKLVLLLLIQNKYHKNKFDVLVVGSTNIETYCRYCVYSKQVSIRMSASATDFFIEFRENWILISQLCLIFFSWAPYWIESDQFKKGEDICYLVCSTQ